MNSDEPLIDITKDVLQGMKIQKVFKDFLKEINSIDFSQNGQYIVACDDNVLNVIDMMTLKKIRTVYIDQCDIDLVKFTDDQNHIICATKSEPYEIQHWALEEHQILKKFSGHTNNLRIYQLEYCKKIILSCSLDGTLRIWQMNSLHNTCYGLLDLYNIPDNYIIGTIDPSCAVFAIAYSEKEQDIQQNSIQLYQMRKFEQGPFQIKKVQAQQYINQIKFSQDIKYLLCVSIDGFILILDGFLLNILIEIPSNQDRMNVSVSFTPDSNYLLTGSQSGSIYLYSIQHINKSTTQQGKQIGKLDGHLRKCKLVYFSPQYCSIVSSCKNLVFWLPYEIQ